MKKVVFICHGNMFRSQTAKAFYNKLAKDGSQAFSYGVSVEEQGHEGLKLSSFKGLNILFEVLKKFDLDISDDTCEQLKEEYLIGVDNIVVMVEKEYIPEWLKKYEFEYWEIPNPEVHTIPVIEEIVELVKGKVEKLINEQW